MDPRHVEHLEEGRVRLKFIGTAAVFLIVGYQLTAAVTAQTPANPNADDLRMTEIKVRSPALLRP